MPIIYHISTKVDWETAKTQGYYVHPTLKDEGFIHGSLDHQVPGVIERYFEGQEGLIKLVIDTNKLTSKYVFDWSPSTADTFPHIYGPINLDAIIETIPL